MHWSIRWFYVRYLGFKWFSLQNKVVIFLDRDGRLSENIRRFHTESAYWSKTAYWFLWLRSFLVCRLDLTIIIAKRSPFFIEQNRKDRNTVFADFVWNGLKKSLLLARKLYSFHYNEKNTLSVLAIMIIH